MKRMLAAILCATVMFTSGGFSTTAYAAAPTEEQITLEEETTNDDAAASGSTEEVTAPSETPAETPAEGTTEQQSEEQKDDDQKSEEVNPDDASNGNTGSAADESSSDDPDKKDDAEGEESGEIPEDSEEEEVEPEEEELEVLPEEELLDTNQLLGTSLYGTAALEEEEDYFFTVDPDGTLRLKEDAGEFNTEVVIPAEINGIAVTKIPAGIFNNKKSFNFVTFDDNNTIREIAEGAFKGSSIRNIEIPAGVTEIKKDTFKNCTDLKDVTFNGNITTIGDEAFYCTDIEAISSATVTAIGARAFYKCENLRRVSFPELTTIADEAFSSCSALDNDGIFSESLTSIGESAFQDCGFPSVNLSSLPEGVRIGNNCFDGNTKLSSVVFPATLRAVPIGMFSGCTGLKAVSFNKGIEEIGSNAFKNCSQLTSLNFPNAYKFGSGAFTGCSSLSIITISHKTAGYEDIINIDEDAFPVKSGITMKGFEVEVQDFAERHGYTFETLKDAHDIKTSVTGSASIKLSANKAVAGTVVKVTVTPSGNYILDSVEITQNAQVDVTPYETGSNYQVFSFVMPDATVYVNVIMKPKADAIKGQLNYQVTPIGKYVLNGKGDNYDLVVTGRECQFKLSDDNGPTNPWIWTFTSSNPKVATVSTTGVIRSVGKGSATIKAVLKTNAKISKSIVVEVGQVSAIGKVTIPAFEAGTDAYSKFASGIASARGQVILPDASDAESDTVPVICFEKHVIANSEKEFNLNIEAFAWKEDPSDSTKEILDTTPVTVSSNWVSTDKNIATVSKATSDNNSNAITIKKGAVGETLVTVSVNNTEKKHEADDNTRSFIIRVIDATPRLNNSTLTVDSNSTVGTALDIVTVYNRGIAGHYLELYTKAKDGSHVMCTDLKVQYKNGAYYISNRQTTPFAKTYSGANQLYLGGKFDGQGKEPFEIPITKVTVTNTALNSAVKVTGKINLFYNVNASAEETGVVTVTQSLDNVKVKKVELVSTANFKSEGSEKDDTFDANFDIAKVDDKTFVITRSEKELVKVNNKNVTAGYIYIYYDGYSAPVKKAITIPTCDTAPDYVLDVTAATASIYKNNQEYELHLVDRKTKKTVQSLANLDTGRTEQGVLAGLGFTQASTDGLFAGIDETALQTARTDNTIRLKVKSTPFKGKAVLYVKMTSWSRPLNYTFTLSTTNALPTVKLSTAAVTLNKTYASQSATITSSQNQPDARLIAYNGVTYKSNAKTDAAYRLLADNMVMCSDGSIEVNLPEGVDKGTYNFTVTPRIVYEDGEDAVSGKALSFRVSVVETNPTLKLSATTFQFNAADNVIMGNEEIAKTYTIGNLPTGVTGEINQNDMIIATAAAGVPEFGSIGTLTFKDGNVVAKLNDKKTTKAYVGKTLKYKVSNLKVDCGADSATIPDFFISIQLVNKAPSITVKVAGTINPIDANSKMTMTATVNNVATNIKEISYYEIDTVTNTPYTRPSDKKDGGDVLYSKHFNLEYADAGKKVSNLTVKPGETVDNGTKYKIRVRIKLEATGDYEHSYEFMVTPKQTLPKVVVDKTAATMFAGQRLSERYVKVKVTLTAPNDGITIDQIDFAKGTPDSVQKAFKIEQYDPKTGYVNLRLVNPSALVLNSTYTINFDTRYANQAGNTTGNRFTIKVTVKK